MLNKINRNMEFPLPCVGFDSSTRFVMVMEKGGIQVAEKK